MPATGPAPGTPAAELRALTGLRIVAAAWVVVFHFHFTALPGVALVVAALGPVVTAGALGVDLFFVLSGFVIAYTYLEKLGPRMTVRATGRFVWARACRIWPAYALVFHMFGIWLVARAVYGTDPDIAFQATQPTLSVGEWVQQLLMVQLWDQPFFDGASWVGSTWSISAEWLAYLLFPLVAVVFHRMRNLPFVVLAGGAVALMAPIALAYLQTGSPYYPWSWVVRILCGFGGGIMTYLAVRRLRSHDGRVRRSASMVASATPVAIVLGLVAGELVGPGRGGAVIVLFPVLVGSLALADRGLARWLSTPAMVHGGRISYALYLIHIPMFEIFWLALRRFGGFGGSTLLVADGLTAHVVGLAVLLATLPAAHLLYRWVEEPARTAMKKLPGLLHGADDPAVTARAQTGPMPRVSTPRHAVPGQDRVEGTRPVHGVPAQAVPRTRPLPVVPEVVVPMAGIPLDTDVARRDPATSEIPVVLPVAAAEKAVGLRGVDWPEPRPRREVRVPAVARRSDPIPNEVARRDPATRALPEVLVSVGSAAQPALPGSGRPGPVPSGPGRPDPRPTVTRPFTPGPAELVPAGWRPVAADIRPVGPAPIADVPVGAPSVPVVAPLPEQRPVERVLAARNAELRSPHPELAEQLVGSALAKGRHRVRNVRPHAAPHIAGQRGPDRRGRSA
ncbi:hypothetical protein GCM10023175_22840 [Pseudonocardia xishanensis]|uniref:Acyltransferase 3 domain-containing protein n=1 Tax=Pseudonocardia xishanensis TaxID=630995 RepID=A0ABP8RQ98_9PSEU